jgi:hypothetical protein
MFREKESSRSQPFALVHPPEEAILRETSPDPVPGFFGELRLPGIRSDSKSNSPAKTPSEELDAKKYINSNERFGLQYP